MRLSGVVIGVRQAGSCLVVRLMISFLVRCGPPRTRGVVAKDGRSPRPPPRASERVVIGVRQG